MSTDNEPYTSILGRAKAQAVSLIPGHSMWDFWWFKWHWNYSLSEYFDLPLLASSQQSSIIN
jgi:hypothetical protein